MDNLNNKSAYYAAILFLVWPLLALTSALKNYSSGWGKNVLWAFVAFYGFSFAIGAENQNSDIVRYVAEIEMLSSEPMTVGSAFDYFLETGEVDIIDTLISIIVSRFTSNQSLITLIYGLIFGFFFSRNMWYVLERLKGKIKPVTILLFACFFLIVPIWDMNGFRMWTAAHVFIYGLLPYLFEGKKEGVAISSLSILVHFSFFVPVGVLYAYMIAGNRIIPYFIFFITTFFISQINLDAFNQIVENYAPEVIQERTAGYRGEQYVENFREGELQASAWYVIWHGRALSWSVMGFLIILFIQGRKFFAKNKKWLSLFSFTLLFYGVANIFSSLPSGGRYLSIAYLLALALLTLYIQNRNQEKVMERFVWVATPALLLYIVVAFRIGLYSMSATAILGNPIAAIFLNGEHISLNDVMKMIL